MRKNIYIYCANKIISVSQHIFYYQNFAHLSILENNTNIIYEIKKSLIKYVDCLKKWCKKHTHQNVKDTNTHSVT